MNEKTAARANAGGLNANRLELFSQIVQGLLSTLAVAGREAPDCRGYLDGKVKIDGGLYPRRLVVLAIEDLKQQVVAPLPLRSEVYELMKHRELEPIPELKLYRDLATAILRVDAALHLARIRGALKPAGSRRI